METIKLTYHDGKYTVNKPGNQDGEYVKLEQYEKLLRLSLELSQAMDIAAEDRGIAENKMNDHKEHVALQKWRSFIYDHPYKIFPPPQI